MLEGEQTECVWRLFRFCGKLNVDKQSEHGGGTIGEAAKHRGSSIKVPGIASMALLDGK